jgi:anti-sigma factor RsiW
MRALLSDFLDHSLHWRTARAMEAHLAACPTCADYVVSVEQTILLYRERPVVDVPPGVRGHLRELLREHHEANPKRGAGRCRADAAAKRPGKPAVKRRSAGTAKTSARTGKAPDRTARKSARP